MPAKLLGNLPPEISAVLAYDERGQNSRDRAEQTKKFAGAFLASLLEDGALFPLAEDPIWLLKMVLTQYEREPQQPIAWLNLGLAFRRMALYRASDSATAKGRWLELALESLEHSLELEPQNARAWFGRGLVFGQLGRYGEEADSYARSVEINPPGLWTRMCLVVALQKSGREREASVALDSALQHYRVADDQTRAELPREMREMLDQRGTH